MNRTFDGCELAPSCFTCRVERCMYGYTKQTMEKMEAKVKRDKGIGLDHALGMKNNELSIKYKVHVRTILRILANAKRAEKMEERCLGD